MQCVKSSSNPLPEDAMPETSKKTPLGEIVREQVQFVQSRLSDFQKDAEKALKELAEKGRESRKEIDRLLSRLEKKGWAERPGELAGKAKDFGTELASHLDELQSKAIEFVGVASRDQVETLAREIKKLATKVETLAKDGKRRGKVGQA
jgi:DNA-binding MarR family transcriptional regulator